MLSAYVGLVRMERVGDVFAFEGYMRLIDVGLARMESVYGTLKFLARSSPENCFSE